jgi:hypothetical protein
MEWFDNNWSSSICWSVVQHFAFPLAVSLTVVTLETNSKVQLVGEW